MLKCWKCGTQQHLLKRGDCFICEKVISTAESVDPENQAAVFCKEHRAIVNQHLHGFAEIFGLEWDLKKGVELGFEYLKEEIKKKYQNLAKDKVFWKETSDWQEELIAKFSNQLKQWIAQINQWQSTRNS